MLQFFSSVLDSVLFFNLLGSLYFAEGLRRIKGESFSFPQIFSIPEQKEIPIEIGYFPDGELYLRIKEPEKIKDNHFEVFSSLNSEEDFLRILFTLATLKEYGAGKISLVLQNWEPEIPEDEMLIYLLGIFADMVGFLEKSSGKIKGIDVSLSPPFSKLSGPIHIDYVTYIQQRFKNDAEEAVKRIQDAQVSSLSINKISSGHWRINIPSNLRGKNIVLIHSTESSKNILELLLMLSYLRKVGVKTISLINTYQGYARQDKVFTPGQGVTAHILLTALNHFLDHNFSVNAHYAERTGPAFLGPEIWIEKQGLRETIQTLYPQGVYNLNGFVQVTEKLMEIVKKEKGDEEFRHYPLLLISPDDGAFSYVKETAEVLKTRYGIEATTGYLNKIRISPTKVEISGPLLGEGGKSLNLSFPLSHYWIFILDDETSTGGTLKVGTYHLVKVLGADGNKIYSGVVHGKFPKDKEKFYNLKEKELLPQIIIALDTLPLPEGIPYASCGPLISFAIKRILGN